MSDFTLDSCASHCFFRDCTTLTPLAAPVPVSLADPTGGPVVAQASTVLPCPAVPYGSLSGLHLPTFLINLVSNAAIQDVWVDTFILGGQCVAICTCSWTGRHLATFTRRTGSSLYTLTIACAQVAEAGQVAALSQVSASGQLAVSCSCRVLSHQTLLWHHRLVHPSLPRLCGMHSRLLVSGLPRSLPSLPRSPTLPCLPNPQPQPPLPPPDLVLRQVLSLLSSTGLTPPLLCSPTDQSPPQLLPGSSLPAPAPHTEVNESLTKRREPETRASTPVRARCVARPRPPAVLGTHEMALRPSSDPRRIVLLEPPVSSLPHVPDPESDLASAASPTITRLLATVVTDPDLESTAAFALVTELVDFAARSHLDYVASLVTESESVCPPSIGGEPALSSDVLEDRQFELECLAAAIPGFASMLICPEGDPDALDIPTSRSYAEAIAGEYSSQWQNAMDAEMASRKSTGTYIDEAPPPGANIIDGIRIFIVKRPPGSPPTFKPRYVARGFNQREGVDFFHTFSPTPKRTTLRVLLHVATQRDYEHFLDFSTAFLQGSLHEEIWLRRPLDFTGSFPARTQWSLRRPVYGLR
ncbi:unnamed protein product [Closterium sp. NIES-54]